MGRFNHPYPAQTCRQNGPPGRRPLRRRWRVSGGREAGGAEPRPYERFVVAVCFSSGVGGSRYRVAARRVVPPYGGMAGFGRSGGGQSRPPLRIGGHCPAGFGRSRAPPLRGFAPVGGWELFAPSSVTAFGRATFSPRRRLGGFFLQPLYNKPRSLWGAGLFLQSD